MPKEQINWPDVKKMHHGNPDDHIDDGPCPCTPTAETMPTVYVRWGAGGHDRLDISNVQITLAVHEHPAWDEWTATDPWAGKSAFPALPVKEEHHSAVLTRSEINKLIKVLRRARDQAYGTDE
jgi:hypothetical protein